MCATAGRWLSSRALSTCRSVPSRSSRPRGRTCLGHRIRSISFATTSETTSKWAPPIYCPLMGRFVVLVICVAWRLLATVSSHRLNLQDWAIYSRFADLVQAEEPWPTCNSLSKATASRTGPGTASAGQGFPGSCSPKNVELSGRSGSLTVFLIVCLRRWFGWGTSYNGSLPSYGLQMELFNASRPSR